MVELMPPKHQLSGIMLTPVVMQIPPNKSALVSIKYTSGFREFNAMTLERIQKEEDKARRAKDVQGLIRDGEEDKEDEEDKFDDPIDGQTKKRKKRRNKKLGKLTFIP